MSIIGLTTTAVSRQTPPRQPSLTAEAPTADPSEKTLTDALAAVAEYVPTEIIAAYTLALAIIVGDEPLARMPMPWFIAFLVLTPLFVWLMYAVRCREARVPFSSPKLWPWWEALAACVAFAAWSAAMPKSALSSLEWYSSSSAAVLLALVSGLLPLVGAVLTKTK